MPVARVFLDSNFLVYQRDTSDLRKHTLALAWTSELLKASTTTPATAWQCLREYYAVVTRKKVKLPRQTAQADIRLWAPLVSISDCDDLEQAWRLEDTYGFHFYDCLILASAVNAGATHLLTEDLQHDQVVDGVRVVNPFLASFHDLGLT